MNYENQDKLQAGSIVRLVDASELDLEEGVLGTLTSVMTIDKQYVSFMPETHFEMFLIAAERVELLSVEQLEELGIQEVYPDLPEELKVADDDTVEDYLPLMNQ